MGRLVDADALCEEFKRRQRAALRWKEEAILADNEESKIRADAVLAFLSEVKLTIDNAPTVEQPTGEWIPVSERLPEDRDWYLGTFREPNTGFIGLPYICDYVGKVTKGTTKEGWILRGFTDIDNACEYHKSLECIAWQSLPKPYKEGGEE